MENTQRRLCRPRRCLRHLCPLARSHTAATVPAAHKFREYTHHVCTATCTHPMHSGTYSPRHPHSTQHEPPTCPCTVRSDMPRRPSPSSSARRSRDNSHCSRRSAARRLGRRPQRQQSTRRSRVMMAMHGSRSSRGCSSRRARGGACAATAPPSRCRGHRHRSHHGHSHGGAATSQRCTAVTMLGAGARPSRPTRGRRNTHGSRSVAAAPSTAHADPAATPATNSRRPHAHAGNPRGNTSHARPGHSNWCACRACKGTWASHARCTRSSCIRVMMPSYMRRGCRRTARRPCRADPTRASGSTRRQC